MNQKHQGKNSGWKKWLTIILLVSVITAIMIVVVKQKNKKNLEGEIVEVKRDNVQVSVQEVGSIEPFRKVEIKSKVSGQVRQVLVDVGDEVKAGHVLMKLDPLDFERNVAQAESRKNMTIALMHQAKAQADIKRKAYQNGAASDSEVIIADGEVKRLNAQLESDNVQYQAAKDQLNYSMIQSPIEGVVLARNVQPGEMVTPGVSALSDGKPLLVVAQIGKLLVRTELNQIDVARIKIGDKVDIKVDAIPGQTFIGEIYRVAAMAQKSERRKDSNLLIFPVDVLINREQKNADALKPGMMADITIGLERHDNVLTVPLEAIVREKGKIQVWKISADKSDDQLVDVVVGLQNEKHAEILSGIEEGQKIRIRPGDASAQVKN